jgi:hypothetical protein
MTQTELNNHIGYIQYKQAKLAEDLSKSMLYGTRGIEYYKGTNNLVGVYIDILYRQDMENTSGNSLSESEIEDIIEDSYRRLVNYD